MEKIFCLNVISKLGTDMLTEDYQLVDKMKDTGDVLVKSAAMHETEFPESLKAVARADAGVSNIPLDGCVKESVVVSNTPGANANSMKELVIVGMLLTPHDVIGGIEQCQGIKEGPNIAKVMGKGKKALAGCEAKGKRLGVIGLGAIGVEVANTVASLGVGVYGCDPFISISGAQGLSRNVKHITSVNTIYQECDYITVHVPLFDTARGMINKTTIDQMKKGVVVLNSVGDLLIDDDDMAVVPNEGKVHKYVTDFPNPEFANMVGAVMTPHLGALTEESEDNCAMMTVQEMMNHPGNGNIKNSVNYPDYSMGVCHAVSHVVVLHVDVPSVIGQIMGTVVSGNVDISDMTNKSRDQYIYTIFDLEKPARDEIIGELRVIDKVLGVRVTQ